MFNDIMKNINLEDPVKEHMPEIIEKFVQFYGEKYRKKITDNLNHTFFIYIQKPGSDDLEKAKSLFAQKREDRIYEYFNENNLDSFTIDEFPQLNFEKWIADVREGQIPPLLSKFIQNYMGFNNTNTYVLLNQSQQMIVEILQNHIKVFNRCLSDLEDLNAEEEKITSYLKKSIKNREDLLLSYNEKSNEILLNFLKKGEKIKNFDEIKPFLTNLREIILKEPALRNTDDQALIEKVWTLCNKENNIQKEEFLKIILDSPITEELAKLHKDYIEKLLKSYPSVEKVMEEINNNGLFEGAIFNSIEKYILTPKSNVVAFIEPTYYRSEPSILYNFCVLPTIFSLNDSTIFNELNHIAVSDMLSNNEKTLVIKRGLQLSYFDKEMNNLMGIMNNSILNEVINEYIALKICRLYEKYGKNIGLLGNFPSNYAKAFPLLRDFIEDNLHDIIKSLMEDVDIKEIIGSKKFDNFSKATKNILLDIQQPNDVSNKLKSKTTHFKKEKNMTSEKLITKSNLAEENRKLYDFDNDYSSEIK